MDEYFITSVIWYKTSHNSRVVKYKTPSDELNFFSFVVCVILALGDKNVI